MTQQEAFNYLKGQIDSQQRQIDLLREMIRQLQAEAQPPLDYHKQ